jgi:hypothetical protein
LPNFLKSAKDATDALALARATRNAALAAKVAAERDVDETYLQLKMRRRHLRRVVKDMMVADQKVGQMRALLRTTGLAFNLVPTPDSKDSGSVAPSSKDSQSHSDSEMGTVDDSEFSPVDSD